MTEKLTLETVRKAIAKTDRKAVQTIDRTRQNNADRTPDSLVWNCLACGFSAPGDTRGYAQALRHLALVKRG